MNIKYAILGFMSWKSFTGYELKKIFAESQAFYWSGNNNQIYRSLVLLHQDGLVTIEVQHQEKNPSRKIYTITDEGRAALRTWLHQEPDAPQMRNTFLIQLAWADQLSSEELDDLLAKYEHEVHMQLLMHRERERRSKINPSRTRREAYLWEMISENWTRLYESDLDWVRRLRSGLKDNFAILNKQPGG